MATVWSRSRDLGSTPTLILYVVVSLDKTLYDDYLCLVASNKQQINWKEIKETTGKLRNEQLLSESGFVQNITPQSLSRDRRIKMEQKTNKQSVTDGSNFSLSEYT